MQGKAGSLHPSWIWRHLQGAHFLPEYGDIPRVEASPILGCGHRNPCFACLASSCSPPRWCRSHFCTLCRELRQHPLRRGGRPRVEGSGEQAGFLPSPCEGLSPQLEGLRPGGSWRPSVWGGCLGASRERRRGQRAGGSQIILRPEGH